MTESHALEATLDDMYQCIMAANFGDLPRIVAKTEQLVSRLEVEPDTTLVARLRHKATRNGLCLQAAARGLRAAQRRIGEMSSTQAGLSTYTSRGQRSEVEATATALRQRL